MVSTYKKMIVLLDGMTLFVLLANPDGNLIRFFDKDLSEDSTDKLYIQENVDSHLE